MDKQQPLDEPPSTDDEVAAILAEYFPDGLPQSATRRAAERGQAQVIESGALPAKPFIDLTKGQGEDEEFLSFEAA